MRPQPVRFLVLPAAVLAALACVTPAFADNVSNSLGANGNTTITLTGSGPGSTSIRYWVDANSAGGNGFAGCDASDGSALTVTVRPPAGVTANPSTLTFTQCGSSTTNTQTVVFSSATVGDYPIPVNVADTHGKYATDAATFTLHVTRPNSPPTVTIGGVQPGAGYEKGAVPAAVCNVSDSEDGATTFPATLSALAGPLTRYGLGSQTATCRYTDGGGLTATATATYSIVDRTAPILHLPGDVVAEATSAAGASATWSVSATDAVDPAPAVSCSAQPDTTFPLGTTPVTCVATDVAGNTASGQFSVVVRDTTAPDLNLPADQGVEATGPAGAAASYPASGHDAVDGDLTPRCVPASGSTFALGATPVNCTVQDAAGNATSGGFTVNVLDTTPPALHLPGAQVLEATGPDGAVLGFPASATDIVDGAVAVTCDVPSGSWFGVGATTVSCTAVDTHGNRATGSFTVTVRDTTAPVLTLPADMTMEAGKAEGADVAYAVSASDAVDGTVGVTCTPADGTFPLGTTAVTCTATDAHGNTASGGFTVTVRDTTPPVFAAVPADQVLEATGSGGAPATFTPPTATDLVAGVRPVRCDAASGVTFALGTTTVTCTAADTAGNTATAAFTVRVVDTTAPVVTVPDDQTVEATGPSGATAIWTAVTAHDLVSGDVPATCDHAPGTGFPLGVTTVTCRAVDAAGNEGRAAFTISVQDRTAPSLTAPDGRTVEATGPQGATATWDGVSATDTVDGPRPVSCDHRPGDLFPLGSTTVTCQAIDNSGNIGYAAFVITVTDTTAPLLVVPDGRTVEATGPGGAPVTFDASATDLVDGAVAVACTPGAGSRFALGEATVTCTATDAHGNTVTRSFPVTVVDTTAPAVTVPADRTVEATGPDGARVDYAASAADLVDGAVPVTCAPAAGTVFPLGASTVTCAAVDAHGNRGSATFRVRVVDTTAPVLDLPAGLTAFATSVAGAPVSYRAVATDAVSGTFAATCTPASGSTFAPGRTTVSCAAVDAAGNRRTGAFSVTVSFDFRGFLAPVDRNAVNVIKNGSTVPIKWQLADQSGGYLGDVATVSRTASGVVACGGGNADDLTTYATGGTSLRYDSTANQYIYNWQSPRTPGTCYRVVIGLTDGQTYAATFQLK